MYNNKSFLGSGTLDVQSKKATPKSDTTIATVLQGKLFCQFCLPLIQELLSFCRESASCARVSCVACTSCPPQLTGPRRDDTGGDDEALPITSFACKWKPPRKRNDSILQIAEASFHKAVYGCQVKHNLSSIADFDPRREEYRVAALSCLQEFLQKVKGEGLSVSVPYQELLSSQHRFTRLLIRSKRVSVARVKYELLVRTPFLFCCMFYYK